MRLLLIRHGQTPANVSGVLDAARPGPGLTDLGRTQAAAIPAALADESLAAVFISPLVRTAETAAPLAAHLSLVPEIVEGFEEIEAGSLQGRSDRASVDRYVETVRAWGDGRLDERMPDGHDGHSFFSRYDGAIAQIVERHADDTVAVVSHGAAIRLWVAVRAVNWDENVLSALWLDNTGIVVLEGSPEAGWRMLSWGGEPAGGHDLADESADDPTGDAPL